MCSLKISSRTVLPPSCQHVSDVVLGYSWPSDSMSERGPSASGLRVPMGNWSCRKRKWVRGDHGTFLGRPRLPPGVSTSLPWQLCHVKWPWYLKLMLVTPWRDNQGHVSWPDTFLLHLFIGKRIKTTCQGREGGKPCTQGKHWQHGPEASCQEIFRSNIKQRSLTKRQTS